MHQKLLYCRDEFSLLAGMFRLALWAVIQASCPPQDGFAGANLSRRTGILACSGRAGWEAGATIPAGSRSYFQLRCAGTICG